ncbi:MAG: hypothetical protein U0M21_07595 [Emergencia sp.]|nr:hypothetical protein [Emergencia sp.]
MVFINELTRNLTILCVLILYFGLIVFLGILEFIFIKKRSRMIRILPFATLFISILIFIFLQKISLTNGYDIRSIEIYKDNKVLGVQHLLINSDRKLIQIGQFITNEGIDSEYINLKFVEGNIEEDTSIGEIDTIITNNLYNYKINFQSYNGKSMIYEDLIRIQEKSDTTKVNNAEVRRIICVEFLICCIPFMVLYTILFSYRFNRRKKFLMLKSKLEDL